MRPPTEEQLNEIIDDGYGLQFEGEPSWFIKAEVDLKEAEIDALEITAEMVADRWRKEEDYLLTLIRHYKSSVEFEMEWQDEVDPAAATEQERLKEAENNHATQKKEYEEGKEKSKEAIDLKRRELAVLRDVLRRSYVGHF